MRPLRLVIVASALAALALALTGCGGGGTASLASDDVAVVGDKHVTKGEFDSLMKQAERSYKSQKRKFPAAGSSEYTALKNQAIQFLVQRAEYEQEADKLGIEVDDKQIDARLKQIKQQYFGGSEAKYRAQLKTQGVTEDQVRNDVRAQILSEEISKKVSEDVKVGDDDIKSYYEKHKQQYGTPETRDIRHILVSNKALANKLFDQLQGGADFAKLAKKYSKDPGSASRGGKLTISKGQTVPPFDQTAFLLGKGQLSRPIKTQYGYHLIEPLSDVKPAKTTPLNAVRASIKQQLETDNKNTAMREWVEDVRKDYAKKIKYASGYAPPATTAAGTTSGG